MTIQDRFTQIGFSKQSVKATPIATADYRIGVTSGKTAGLSVDQEQFDISWSSRINEGHDRGTVEPVTDFETLGMAKTIGLFLLAALGSDTVAGSGPYTHTFKPGNALPYLSVFTKKDTETHRLSDVRIDELEISWDTVKAVKVKVKAMGCVYEFGTAFALTGGTGVDERPKDGVLKGAGGTFTIDGNAAVVKSGTIKITNSLESVYGSDSVSPKDVFPAAVDVNLSLTVIPADTTLFRQVVTGTSAGTAIQVTPEYGAAVVSFSDGTSTLTANFVNVAFMTEFPDTKAKGGPVEVALEANVAANGSDPVTFVLVNGVATY